MALDKVTAEEIILIQDKLNNRPRKLLGYKTPNEVYAAMRLAA
jgi:IS30 family transposase